MIVGGGGFGRDFPFNFFFLGHPLVNFFTGTWLVKKIE